MSEEELTQLQRQVQREHAARKEAERLLDEKSRELFFANQQLYNARDRNQHYLDIVQTIIVALDNEGRLSMANRAGCALLGQSESELLGQRWFKYFVPPCADAERALKLFQRLVAGDIQTGEAQSEYPILDSNGQQHLIAWRLSLLTDAAGQIVGVLGAGEDITERKLAEKFKQFRSKILELLARDGPLSSTLEAIALGVEQLNPGMLCSILLLDSEGKHLGVGVAPSLPDFYNAAIDGIEIGPDVGSCGTAAFTGERVIVADIATHPYWAPFRELTARAGLGACWSQPIRSSSSQIVGTFAIYHREVNSPSEFDIFLIEQSAYLVSIAIDRKLAQEELAHERFLLKALMDNVPDHVYFKDCDNRFILINKAFAKSLGLDDPANVQGKTDFDLFTEEHAQQAYKDEQDIIRSNQPLTIEEKETWPDKPDTWVSTTKIPLRDEKGNVVGTFGVSRTITERRQVDARIQSQILELTALNNKLGEAQSQLLHSEKMAAIGQLAAGVAHEINNPIGFVNSNLASLRTYAGQLLSVINAYEQGVAEKIGQARQAADLDFLREDLPALLSESQEGLDRVTKIVQALKDFSRVDDTGRQLADLNAAMESTLNVVWNELKYKAELIRELGDLPKVDCIPAQINQVFTNLLVNAAQAIPVRGKIFVRSRLDGDTVCFEIEDTGQGMSEEVRRRIFEPFFTTKPVGKGTGLGLSISYDIVVKKHGGRLEVTSEPGKGTCFLIALPLVFKTPDA